MDVKKEGVIFLIAFLLTGSLLVGIVSAEYYVSEVPRGTFAVLDDKGYNEYFENRADAEAAVNKYNGEGLPSSNDFSKGPEIDKEGGLWGFIVKWYNKIMDYTLRPVGRFLQDMLGRIFGYKTLEGESRVFWKPEYWWGHDTAEEDKWGEGAINALFALEVLILTILFEVIQIFIEFFSGHQAHPNLGLGDYFRYSFEWARNRIIVRSIIILLIFPIGMGIPVLNRFLQIVTLEPLFSYSLAKTILVRAIYVSVIIFFFPKLWNSFLEARKKRYLYKIKLKQAAKKEAAGALLD